LEFEIVTASTRAYLDHNATTPVRPDVALAMARALMLPGNPSSVHSEGRAARAAIEQARTQVARLVGAKAEQCRLHQRRHRGQCDGAVAWIDGLQRRARLRADAGIAAAVWRDRACLRARRASFPAGRGRGHSRRCQRASPI
jgi:hypothetical protein